MTSLLERCPYEKYSDRHRDHHVVTVIMTVTVTVMIVIGSIHIRTVDKS